MPPSLKFILHNQNVMTKLVPVFLQCISNNYLGISKILQKFRHFCENTVIKIQYFENLCKNSVNINNFRWFSLKIFYKKIPMPLLKKISCQTPEMSVWLGAWHEIDKHRSLRQTEFLPSEFVSNMPMIDHKMNMSAVAAKSDGTDGTDGTAKWMERTWHQTSSYVWASKHIYVICVWEISSVKQYINILWWLIESADRT